MLEEFGTSLPEKIRCKGCGKLIVKAKAIECDADIPTLKRCVVRYGYYCMLCVAKFNTWVLTVPYYSNTWFIK